MSIPDQGRFFRWRYIEPPALQAVASESFSQPDISCSQIRRLFAVWGESHGILQVARDVQVSGQESQKMRSIILYVLGVPVAVIALIALFTHHF